MSQAYLEALARLTLCFYGVNTPVRTRSPVLPTPGYSLPGKLVYGSLRLVSASQQEATWDILLRIVSEGLVLLWKELV